MYTYGSTANSHALSEIRRAASCDGRLAMAAPPSSPTGMRAPTGLRPLDPRELTLASAVYGTSLDFSRIALSDAAGLKGRPFTTFVPGTGMTVINVGPGPFATPASAPRLLIHELAHSWQSQHDSDPTAFMVNSVASQALALVAGGSAYCYVRGKPFENYAAEQIAQQVENGEAPIIAHIKSATRGSVDSANIRSLRTPRWEKPGALGVVC